MKIAVMGKFLHFVTGGNIRAITLCPFGIYVNNEEIKKDKRTINHEKIHWKQQQEMLIIFFYLWYLIEWITRIFINGRRAYISIAFEQESYDNDDNLKYLETRKKYSWIKYLGKNIWENQ